MKTWPVFANIEVPIHFEKCTHGAKDATGWITAPFQFFSLYFRYIHFDFCLRREGRFRFGIAFLPYLWPFKRIFLMLEKKDKTKKEQLLWCRKILCLTCHIFTNRCQKVWKEMVRKMVFYCVLIYIMPWTVRQLNFFSLSKPFL